MKNVYVAPKLEVTKISVTSVLVSSVVDEKETLFAKTCQEGWTFQRCPFNNKWCYDKQKRFNEWREMIEYCAKNNINRTFFTGSKDCCPHGYHTLCADYKQKQRG